MTEPTQEPTYEQLQEQLDRANVQLARIAELVKEQEDRQRSYRGYGTLADKLRDVLHQYQAQQDRIIGGAKAFNQDLIIYLRAIGLVAAMVGNGGTHREKDARLRGLIEQIESAIQKLRDEQFNFDRDYYWRAPDVWRSDYPVLEYLQRNRALEQQLNELKAENATLKGEPPAQQPDERSEAPF